MYCMEYIVLYCFKINNVSNHEMKSDKKTKFHKGLDGEVEKLKQKVERKS